jgi:hypothetical protein
MGNEGLKLVLMRVNKSFFKKKATDFVKVVDFTGIDI